jgi:hypothetical protein
MSMYDWRIIEFDGGQSLVGFLENGLTCRLTTEITSIDLPAREVRTRSGRLYELLGPPASEPERLEVIAVRVAVSVHAPWLDITDAVWTAMCEVTA